MDETLKTILQWLIIIFFTILPFLVLVLIISFEINPIISKYLKIFICFALPAILILTGIIVGINNYNINILDISASWYYIISIVWLSIGIIFYSTIE